MIDIQPNADMVFPPGRYALVLNGYGYDFTVAGTVTAPERCLERVQVLKAHVAVEVVPGITAAQGAASRLCVSLTQRHEARRVQYVTGHGADGVLPGDIDWRSLADPAATTIIYIPVKTLGELTARAITAGLDPATPAVAVARATRPNEARIVSTVGDLPDRLAESRLPGPVVVMIGRTFAGLAAAQAPQAEALKTMRDQDALRAST